MKIMKLAIVGTRNPGVTYQEWEKLLFDKINPHEIQMAISGGAKGVDAFAKLFAAFHQKSQKVSRKMERQITNVAS